MLSVGLVGLYPSVLPIEGNRCLGSLVFIEVETKDGEYNYVISCVCEKKDMRCKKKEKRGGREHVKKDCNARLPC